MNIVKETHSCFSIRKSDLNDCGKSGIVSCDYARNVEGDSTIALSNSFCPLHDYALSQRIEYSLLCMHADFV